MNMVECDKCGQPYGFGCMCDKRGSMEDYLKEENAKLREQLTAMTMTAENFRRDAKAAEAKIRRLEENALTSELIEQRLYAQLNAAEAKLKAASEQEPVAAPVPPVDVQKLQKQVAYLDNEASKNADLNNRQAIRIAELERKLAEQQALILAYRNEYLEENADGEHDCVTPLDVTLYKGTLELNILLAQAREAHLKGRSYVMNCVFVGSTVASNTPLFYGRDMSGMLMVGLEGYTIAPNNRVIILPEDAELADRMKRLCGTMAYGFEVPDVEFIGIPSGGTNES